MNKTEKELLQDQLNNEKEIIKELKKAYKEAEKQIDEKIERLMGPGYEEMQSKVYQIEFQKSLKDQIGVILDQLNSKNYQNVEEYIEDCYDNGWIGEFYDLKDKGIPIIAPIDQNAVVKAIRLDSKLSKPLYEQMGVNIKDLKKNIAQEVSRGLSSGLKYNDIARNISNQIVIDLNKSIRIARTEGHRVLNQATVDAMHKAKNTGADIVKQWDATLDKKTRPSHQKVDGEIRELDEPFSNGLMFPGADGPAKEVVNCRCALLQRARWALDDEELTTLKERAQYFDLDKTDNFEDFKKKYLKAVEIIKCFNCYGDYLRNVLGPALTNNKEEVDEIVKKVKDTGGSIIFLKNNTKMVCNVMKGRPASIEVDENISIAGLKHEFRHYLDDLENGCPGLGYYLVDSDAFYNLEVRGYEEELAIARENGYTEIEKAIEKEIEKRKGEIYGSDGR